jgi:2-amino-4-hydroxy-6-hydroxymethyldihydropteridine diphosphokinase
MQAVIGLGANLGSREANLRAAVDSIARLPECCVLAWSSIYQTDPVGPPQPRYLNAAIRIKTDLDANALLDRLKAIEVELGRETTERWGARIIDLDILWSDTVKMQTSRLTIPHPCLEDRAFALAPLLDVTPQLAERYARQLDALGGKPDQVGRLDRQPQWRLVTSDDRYKIEVRSFDRCDALALALSGLAQHCWKQDKERAFEIKVVQKECKPGEECPAFVRETVEVVRSGFRYCWALVSTLHSGRVCGRLAGQYAGEQPIEMADVAVEDSGDSAIILLSRPVAKFNKPKFL